MYNSNFLFEVDHLSVDLYGDRMIIVFDVEGIALFSDDNWMCMLSWIHFKVIKCGFLTSRMLNKYDFIGVGVSGVTQELWENQSI